ncbi:MAG TPA: type 4a pilus biogenesis protein PilO [Longimicrobiales bacterium]|nr:type 4a pilus biogenesis protein PilO [Longimicrobiales bacterium]
MAFSLSIPKDKPSQQKLLLAILPFLIFFGWYQFVHGKAKPRIEEATTRLEQLEAVNGAAKAKALTGGPELQQKLALYEQHMKRLEELIPKKEEVASLLNGLSERAIDSNVDLALMKPELAEPGQFYTQQTYQLTAIGTYHDIGRYLAAIASLPRIITPIEVAIKPRPAAEMTRDGRPKLNADFHIVTYVIPEPPVSPGAAQGNPPAQGGASGSH